MGCVRKNNEDNARFTFLKGSKFNFIAVIADGMGGYERGEEASEAMVEQLCAGNGKDHRNMGRNPKRWLLERFSKANGDIFALSQKYGETMGTTCSTLLIWNKRLWCAHIGDSRIYMFSKGNLTQITCDHTVVGMMKRSGGITAEEASVHPQRSVLTKAVGTSARIAPDIFNVKQRVQKGDRFLLCSDGLYDLVSDAEICSIITQKSLKQAAASLITTAKEYGGDDNVTVVLVEITHKTEEQYEHK